MTLTSLTELARLLTGEDDRDGDLDENTDEYRRLLLVGLGILVIDSPDERPLSELGDPAPQELGCLGSSGER